jgi:hypothetical protein
MPAITPVDASAGLRFADIRKSSNPKEPRQGDRRLAPGGPPQDNDPAAAPPHIYKLTTCKAVPRAGFLGE